MVNGWPCYDDRRIRGVPGQVYRYQFSGWMYHFDYLTGDYWYGYGRVTGRFSSSAILECYDFWWDPARGGTGGYLQIYEEGTSRPWNIRRGGPKVLGKWIASVDFYPYQQAALVYLNNSAVPFALSQYYCTIDWEDPIPLNHGYTEGSWVYRPWQYPNWNGWCYGGDPGSPRFHYRRNCSVTISPPSPPAGGPVTLLPPRRR